MATSQNGYLANDRSVVHTLTVPGTNVRLPVRKGPAGDLLLWAALRWHREVEPLVDGWNWGYASRLIRGSSTTLSNHASGTAIDLNAPRHPLGVAVSKTFTPAQVATIRKIVADTSGCLVWGGEWSRPDVMHLEIAANEARCAAVLAKLKPATPPPPQEVDMSAGFEKDSRARWPREDLLERDLRADLAAKQKLIEQLVAGQAELRALVEKLVEAKQ